MKREEATRRWAHNILASIDSTSEETRRRLMESCGRNCARSSVVNSAARCRGDLGKFLGTMRKWIGKDNVLLEGNRIDLTYDRCLCPLPLEVPESLASTFCNCSRGWLLEMFELVVGRPVEVELVSSIKAGGDKCRFVVLV